MRYILSIGLVLLLALNSGWAQKIKYKDLFPLLSAENYGDADPFLRKFLRQNPGHPDANYRMGRMLESYLYETDVLQDPERVAALADSALYYLKNATGLITEKYAAKHDDDYYLKFKRRNLRTGKFEVKLSDIRLDIEERQEAIEKYRQAAAAYLTALGEAEDLYKNCQEIYLHLVQERETTLRLYFTATPEDLQHLRDLAAKYDSVKLYLNRMAEIKMKTPKLKVDQRLTEKPIEQFPLDGVTPATFGSEQIDIWKYGDWARAMLDKIGKEIYPLKKRMIEYCARLDELSRATREDSVDARAEIFHLTTANVGDEIGKYVEKSLPAAIYAYRLGEINYHSTINHWLKEVYDTTDVGLKLTTLFDLQNQYEGLLMLADSLRASDTPESRQIFADFIKERFGSSDSLEAFIDHEVRHLKKEGELLESWLRAAREEDRYTRWQADILALTPGQVTFSADSLSSYTTLAVDSLNERERTFYAIKERKGAAPEFVFGLSPSSRQTDTLYVLPLPKKAGIRHAGELGFLTATADSLTYALRLWVLYADHAGRKPGHYLVLTTHYREGAGEPQEHKFKSRPAAVIYDEPEKVFVILDEAGQELLRLNVPESF